MCPIDCIHELYLHVEHNVLALGLRFRSTTLLIATEHLFKLLKDVPERRLAWTSLLSSKLLREAFKASETLTTPKWISTSKRSLTSEGVLSLLVACHSSLIIDTTLAIITESLVGIVNLGKLFLGLSTRINIWMVLLRELKVRLLDV